MCVKYKEYVTQKKSIRIGKQNGHKRNSKKYLVQQFNYFRFDCQYINNNTRLLFFIWINSWVKKMKSICDDCKRKFGCIRRMSQVLPKDLVMDNKFNVSECKLYQPNV